MKKTRNNLYFEKKYCLLIHSVAVTHKLLLATVSNNAAQTELTDKTCTYAINQLLYINCIESVIDGMPVSDAQPVVKITVWGDKSTKKHDIGTIRFDMNYQKIVKPESTVMFSKEIEGTRGMVHYKFINLKTKTITLEEYQLSKSRKNQILMDINKDENNDKIKQLMTLLQQKNQLIYQLQLQTQKLIVENKRKNSQLELTQSFSKEKQINLNIKVKAPQNLLKKQNDQLKQALLEKNQYIDDLKEQIQNLTQEKEYFELEMRKKLKQIQKIDSLKRQNFFLRNSNVETKQHLINSIADPADSQVLDLPSNQPVKMNFIQPRQKRHTDIGDIMMNKSVVLAKQNSHLLQLHQKRNRQLAKQRSIGRQEEMNRITFSNMNSTPDVKISQVRNSKAEDKQEDEAQNFSIEHSEVQIKINMQKQDFKWNSMLFQQKEELQILKKKLEIYMSQNKNTQKELERCKQTIKKKDTEIRQLRRLSRKNLHFGDGKDTIRDKNEFEMQLEKIEAQNDTEKITFQQEIQTIDKDLQQKIKENKLLKINYQQASARQKTYEERYKQLKVFNKKLSQDVIEFKEKASLYDITMIKNRELESANKILTTRTEKATSEAHKFQDLYQKTLGRVKDFQKEHEKLKRMQRQYDYYRQQNFSQKQAIDVCQLNFIQLKKFCQRIELAYNKFVSSKKHSSSISEGSGFINEKQMHGKFVELAKKFNQFQLDYYNNQLQDLKEERQFINEYYDHKKLEEKGKFQFKQMAEKSRQEYLKNKQIQIQKSKQEKLTDINKKMQSIQISFDQVQQKVNESSQTLIVSMPQKMKRMQQKLSTLIEKEHIRQTERKALKETMLNLKQDLKTVKSSSIAELNPKLSGPVTLSVPGSGKSNLLQSMIQQNKAKMSQLQEVKMKNERFHIHNMEENRKMNMALKKQNSDFRIELQKLKMESEKAERKYQENEKRWQEINKKTQTKHKIQVDKLHQTQQNLQNTLQKIKSQLEDQKNSTQILSEQLTLRNEQINEKQYRIGLLYERNENMELTVSQCEKAQKKMKQEVEQIKKKAQLTQQQFVTLMQARSEQFIKIQKLKNAEIYQLKKSIKQLETTFETQLSQNFSLLKLNQTLKEQTQKVKKQVFSKFQYSELLLQNKSIQFDQLYLKQFACVKQNQVLKIDIIQISSKIQTLQIQKIELSFQVQSLQKQIQVHQNKDADFKKLQTQLREEISHVNSSLDDKIYKLKLYESKFMKLQTEVELAQMQNQALKNINQKYSATIEQLSQKINNKIQEIIKNKQQSSILSIEIKKLEYLMEKLQMENTDLKKHNQQLQNEIHKHVEVGVNVSNIGTPKMTKKSSIIDPKQQEPSSPTLLPRGLPKRSQSVFIHDTSGLNFGGINPIVPIAPQAFPNRKESIEMKAQNSVINIEFQQSSNTTNKLMGTLPPIQSEQSVTGTAIGNMTKPFFGDQQIREATQQNQEQNSDCQNNYNLQDKEQRSQATQREILLREYEEKIKELENELQRFIEENQALKSQNLQLHQKVEETAHIGSRHHEKVAQNLTVQIMPETSMVKQESSRRPSILEQRRSASFKTSREIPAHDSPTNSRDVRKKSQNAILIVQSQYSELKQKFQSAELQIEQLNNHLTQLKDELKSLVEDNQKLMQQAVDQAELMQKMSQDLQEARWQAQQSKKFEVFEEMYKNERVKIANYQAKVEQLMGEILQKDEVITNLHIQNSENINKYNSERDVILKIQKQKEQIESRVKQLTSLINKMKVQYRKYEEDSQIEIVHLREEIDHLRAQIQAKKQQMEEVGERYLQLQAQKEAIEHQLAQTRQSFNMKHNQLEQNKEMQSKIEQELSKREESKQNLYKTIKKLEKELLQKSDEIRSLTSQSTLSIKKYEIKLQSDREEMNNLNEKIAQKQKVISLLKNQIALYNQQCQELKKSNDLLNFQLIKVERQLKDIMQVYEKEVGGLKLQIQSKTNQLYSVNKRLKQREGDIVSVSKQLRLIEKERDSARSQSLQNQSLLERLKKNKNKQYGEINTKLQFSINQCEKLKVSLMKTKEQLQSRQNQIKQLSKNNETKFKGYKEKYQKYEKIIEDFSEELKKVEERPTYQAYQEVLFQNQLLRNQIQQLKEEIGKVSSKVKQQQIYQQFRKYKANKQREIQDLQAQMQKYGIKINELQQSIFMLKQDNQGLLKTNFNLQEEKDELEMEYQNAREEIMEVQKELQFYKKRKILDMQKLLNDTQ